MSSFSFSPEGTYIVNYCSRHSGKSYTCLYDPDDVIRNGWEAFMDRTIKYAPSKHDAQAAWDWLLDNYAYDCVSDPSDSDSETDPDMPDLIPVCCPNAPNCYDPDDVRIAEIALTPPPLSCPLSCHEVRVRFYDGRHITMRVNLYGDGPSRSDVIQEEETPHYTLIWEWLVANGFANN